MKIEHMALWTRDLEASKGFYCEYFGGTAGALYSKDDGFRSYFISLDAGARLEIMTMPAVEDGAHTEERHYGYSHLAFAVGSEQGVDELTARLAAGGVTVISGPRRTGDGYYESCVLDPDGNRVEITV